MANEISDTEVSVSQNDILLNIIQQELINSVVLAGTTKNMSDRVGKGMKSVSLFRAGSFAAENKAENTALSNQVITYVQDQLDLDQKKAVLASIEGIPEMQSILDVKADVAARIGRELALELDQYIYTKLQLASASAPDHRIAWANNPTDTIQETDILEARKLLNIQNAPMSDRFLAVSPGQEKNMLLLNNFIEADKYGAREPIVNGELGRVYGFRVVVSNEITDTGCVAYHKDAVAWAMQKMPTFDIDKDLDNIATKILGYTVFGAKELQAGRHQVLLGSAS